MKSLAVVVGCAPGRDFLLNVLKHIGKNLSYFLIEATSTPARSAAVPGSRLVRREYSIGETPATRAAPAHRALFRVACRALGARN